MSDKNQPNREPNQLINSSSPYLLQHAYNPVEWYPWGNEALEMAKKQDKPILVSIGYSSCHWCHVMERECFENDEVADIMNAHFINIKVDREERPDVDQVYMEAVHAMGLQGGWPLNVFLTPNQKPFYGGTYFPPQQWSKLLLSVSKAFKENRKKLEESANKFTEAISQSEIDRFGLANQKSELKEDLIRVGYFNLAANFDKENGGLKRAPKFPMPSIYQFMLQYYHLMDKKEALDQVELTLDKMWQGGIYDHVGGGFARYSVDELWHVPHFEKMLYDNGQLLSLYSQAYLATNKKTYLQVVEDTVEWLKREMLSPQGGFYSALDADSEGEEGKYYVWEQQEIESILGDESILFNQYYSISAEGNWEEGKNILHAISDPADFAKKYTISEDEFSSMLKENKNKLLRERSKRVAPGLDDKIITGWNALVLKGLVDAYQASQNEEYLNLALKNAEFLYEYMFDQEKGYLYRNWQSSNPSYQVSAVLEDYALTIDALLSLYQVTFNERWLEWSRELLKYALENFFDKKEHFFFYKNKKDEALIARKKELFDNVIPSSNAVMAQNMYRLGTIFDNASWVEISKEMVATMNPFLDKALSDSSYWGLTYLMMLHPLPEVVIVGSDAIEKGRELLSTFYPNKIVLGTENESELPLLKGRQQKDGKTTIFVCFNKACKLPVHSVKDALEQMP